MPEVVKWASGGTPKSSIKEFYENGTIPWIIIGDLNDGFVDSAATMITELGLKNSSAKMIPAGTLLVAMYGSIGKLGITRIECCTNQAIAYAKELYKVTTEYMFYFMSMLKPKLLTMGKGGTQQNISQTVLNSLYVIVPPLPEQRRIVAIIEELFSELDKGVAELQKVKTQLKIYRQAVLNEAFSWCESQAKINDVCVCVSDGDHMPPPKAKAGIPFVMISNIVNNRICWDETNFVGLEYYQNIGERRTPQKGDVLYTVTGSYGIPVLVDFDRKFCFQRHIALLRPNEKVHQKFLYYAMQNPKTYQQATSKATGTAQKTVPLSVLREIMIPMASLDKQCIIVKEIESRLSVCDKIEQTVDESLKKAEQLRQSILKQAFEGKLV